MKEQNNFTWERIKINEDKYMNGLINRKFWEKKLSAMKNKWATGSVRQRATPTLRRMTSPGLSGIVTFFLQHPSFLPDAVISLTPSPFPSSATPLFFLSSTLSYQSFLPSFTLPMSPFTTSFASLPSYSFTVSLPLVIFVHLSCLSFISSYAFYFIPLPSSPFYSSLSTSFSTFHSFSVFSFPT